MTDTANSSGSGPGPKPQLAAMDRSFTNLWPINTASVNITVRRCDLCLTLVKWEKNREAGSSYFSQVRPAQNQSFSRRSCLYRWDREPCLQVAISKRFRKPGAACGAICIGLLFTECIFGVMWYSEHVPEWGPTLYSSNAWRKKKRKPEIYKDQDKGSSQRQVSRPGQLNTESDPSTHAHPWESEIEEGRMERGRQVYHKGSFEIYSLEAG